MSKPSRVRRGNSYTPCSGLFDYLFVCLFVCLYVCLFVCLSVCCLRFIGVEAEEGEARELVHSLLWIGPEGEIYSGEH